MRDYENIILDCHTCAEIGCGRRECSHKDADGCEAQLMIDAADAIEELVAAVPQWISVEERLPEVTTKVLTYNGTFVSENWLCTIADKDGKREIWAYSEGFVTHWMPLPSTEGLNEA